MPLEDRFIKVREAAKICKVSPATMRKLARKAGAIITFNGLWLIDMQRVLDLLDQLRTTESE